MKIKTISGIALLLVVLPCSVYAQYPTPNQQASQVDTPPGTHKKNLELRANEKLAKLDSVVHLTPQQKSQLKATYTRVERQEFQNNQTTHDKETLKQLNNKVELEKWNAWHKVLSPEQSKKWELYRKAQATGNY